MIHVKDTAEPDYVEGQGRAQSVVMVEGNVHKLDIKLIYSGAYNSRF